VKFRQRLSVSKQAAQRFDMDKFNLKKLNDMDVREQYQLNISNRFLPLENLMMMMMMMMMMWTSVGLGKVL